jgi:hypothetical protein
VGPLKGHRSLTPCAKAIIRESDKFVRRRHLSQFTKHRVANSASVDKALTLERFKARCQAFTKTRCTLRRWNGRRDALGNLRIQLTATTLRLCSLHGSLGLNPHRALVDPTFNGSFGRCRLLIEPRPTTTSGSHLRRTTLGLSSRLTRCAIFAHRRCAISRSIATIIIALGASATRTTPRARPACPI